MEEIVKVLHLPFKYHLVAGAFIRLLLIFYADFHDKTYDVPYTDVDYKVFTDAARYVLNGDSPYKRHTFRYSPIIAFLLVPNVAFSKHFGKVLFSAFDILVTITLKFLVEHLLATRLKGRVDRVAVYSSLFWLYNPMSIAISTRGNADSVPCFFIILSIFFLQTDVISNIFKYILSGILLGISIHLRLYPLAFSFPMYLSLGDYKIYRNTPIMAGLHALLPNKKQITLTLSCIVTLLALTFGLYQCYGYEFLFETYIYHLIRKDTRHNFSVLFYYSYLTADQLSIDILKVFSQVSESFLLFIVSLSFGCNSETLPFALFSQAVILVTFNSVITSQYFIWFLSLLPLVVQDFKLSSTKASFLIIIWFFSQGGWLFYAYLLEFQCKEVFIFIWWKGTLFFCANIFVLGQLIECYTPGYGFGLTNEFSKIKTH